MGSPAPEKKMRRSEVLPRDDVRWAVRARKGGESSDPAEADHLYLEMEEVANFP